MRNIRLLFFFLASTTFFISCQKEADLQFDTNPGGGGTTNPTNKEIIGDYNFVGIASNANTTVTASSAGSNLKTISTTNYSSVDNSGTAKITASEVIFTDVAYGIHTTSRVQLYMDNILISNQPIPFDQDPTPASSTESYTKNSADSITFSNVPFVASNPFDANVTPAPMGAKLSWSGDTLFLKIKHVMVGSIDYLGTPAAFSGAFDAVIKLKKK